MKILIYDATEKTFVGKTWKWGAKLFAPFFDAVIAAKSWDHALSELEQLDYHDPFEMGEVQVWSHGLPGKPMINGKSFPLMDARVTIPERWWFRCCYALAGAEGHYLASSLANRGVDVAGHTVVIGRKALHPRLYALEKFEDPYWSKEMPEDHLKPSVFSPRTITAFNMEIPDWAWHE